MPGGPTRNSPDFRELSLSRSPVSAEAERLPLHESEEQYHTYNSFGYVTTTPKPESLSLSLSLSLTFTP